MRLGIIGLPGCGKTTVFNALTSSSAQVADFSTAVRGPNLAVVKIPEPRLPFLAQLYNSKKVTEATVDYVDVGGLTGSAQKGQELGETFLSHVRPVDALVHVVRNFHHPMHGAADPLGDISRVETELILADLLVVEKRLERIAAERQRGKKENPEEVRLLQECQEILEASRPLRSQPGISEIPLMRGFSFLSAKPLLILVNQPEEDVPPLPVEVTDGTIAPQLEIVGKLEMELAQLSPDEASEFMVEMGLETLAREQVIQASSQLLGLISFFTTNEQEARAWTVKAGTPALQAAGVVHSDMERGFIRAEVVQYDDLEGAGSYAVAQKQGLVRLEGKEYIVQDGDVIFFRFKV
ncbi:MAG: redox-regulated ATPase YchF [Deltaproteobacteria bacterium]|nr:MAG: redox-regulated ATPase YchF [Deltaproteobacteria bacterium]